jgi:hypothetical protein
MMGDYEQVAAEYLSSGRTNMQIKGLFQGTRTVILKDDKYEDPEGRPAIISLANDPETSEVDRQRLLDLSTKTMRQIHFAIANRSPFLQSTSLLAEFRKIKIVRSPFEDFVLPSKMWAKVSEENRQRILDRNCHKRETRDEVNQISISEAEAMRQQAVDHLRADIQKTKKADGLRLIDALSILTGRRRKELYETLQMKCVPDNEYQAQVRGFCKVYQHLADKWITIPLLAPYSLIVRGICNLRQITGITYLQSGKLFAKPFTHTTYRNLYSEMAWRERHSVNKFMIGDQDCSPLAWRGFALGVSLSDVAMHYSIMCVNEQDQDDSGTQPKRYRDNFDFQQPQDLASASEGPFERLRQDPL